MLVEQRFTVTLRQPRVIGARVNGQRVSLHLPAARADIRLRGVERVALSFGPRTLIQEGVDDVDVDERWTALLAASGDYASPSALAYTPRPESALTITINGQKLDLLGDGTKVGCEFWFSRDGSDVPLPRADIRQGDRLRWGDSAGYPLSLADEISVSYERLL